MNLTISFSKFTIRITVSAAFMALVVQAMHLLT